MKQKRDGQKIQNWHRPLWPNELKHSYRRDRESWDLEKEVHDEALMPMHLADGRIRCYCCWGNRDLCYDQDHDQFDNDRWEKYQLRQMDVSENSELIVHYLRDLVRDLSSVPSPIFPCTTSDSPGRSEEDVSVLWQQPVEEMLFEFIDLIRRLPNSKEELRLWYRLAPFQPEQLNRLTHASNRDDNQSNFVLRVFSPFWLRDPDELAADAKFTDICRWLFCRQPSPNFLFTRQWCLGLDEPDYKWIIWTIIVGYGGSLKRAAKFFHWKIRGKFQYMLCQLDQYLVPGVQSLQRQAVTSAEILRLGGSDIEIRRISQCEPLLVDLTMATNTSLHGDAFDRFWNETVRWLIAHRDQVNTDESLTILDWAYHEYCESERLDLMIAVGTRQRFSWKGRSVAATRRNAQLYQQELLDDLHLLESTQPLTLSSWEGHGWDRSYANEAGAWSFVELTSATQLREEGKVLQHCVGSYAAYCARNRSAIVSLRLGDTRCITIELNLATKQVVQARGHRNRGANTTEREIIEAWHKEAVQATGRERGASTE